MPRSSLVSNQDVTPLSEYFPYCPPLCILLLDGAKKPYGMAIAYCSGLLNSTLAKRLRISCHVRFDCLDEMIEIVATSSNIGDETNIFHRPVSMDQAVSEIEKGLEALIKVF